MKRRDSVLHRPTSGALGPVAQALTCVHGQMARRPQPDVRRGARCRDITRDGAVLFAGQRLLVRDGVPVPGCATARGRRMPPVMRRGGLPTEDGLRPDERPYRCGRTGRALARFNHFHHAR